MNDFNLFLPLTKVEKHKDGSCTVSGYASTPTRDLDGEIVSLDAVKAALPGYWEWRNIREMHTASAVGVAKEANVDDKGLFLTAKIIDPIAVQKCLDEVYKGFSIGGRKLAKSGDVITEIELVEISVVDRPSNPDCRISVSKSAKTASEGAYLVKAKTPKRPEVKVINHLAKAVEVLSKAENKTDLEPAPVKPVKMDNQPLCKKHGMAGCPKCAKKLAKRKFKEQKRKELASEGKALPDGSFPIENKEDLVNAERLVGHAKNPEKAKRFIRRRAKELGIKLPESYTKKYALSLIKAAEMERVKVPAPVTIPELKTISDKEITKRAKALTKKVSDEDYFEKGFAMTTDNLDSVIMNLVKAAKNPSRAQRFHMARENMKKARMAQKNADKCMKAAHAMCKSAYLAKRANAQKNANDPDMDLEKVMEKVSEAHQHLTKARTFSKAASMHLKKAAPRAGQKGQEVTDPEAGCYEVPAGVKELSPADLATASPGGPGKGSEPVTYNMETPYPKMAKKITPEMVELIERAARAEGKAEALEALPLPGVNRQRPYAFDVTKLGVKDKTQANALFNGVDPAALASGEEEVRKQAVGKVIGNMILNGMGKSVFDADFHGTAGMN
jgi:phage head maturation protease